MTVTDAASPQTVIPIPVASAACAASCDQSPVKARDEEEDATPEEVAAAVQKRHVEARACGLFKGDALKLCQEGCSTVCVRFASFPLSSPAAPSSTFFTNAGACRQNAIPIAAAKDACVASCKAGSLKVRDPEPAPAPLTGGQVCRGACAVTCNSTVLALVQKKCLSVCVSISLAVLFPTIHPRRFLTYARRQNGKCPSD